MGEIAATAEAHDDDVQYGVAAGAPVAAGAGAQGPQADKRPQWQKLKDANDCRKQLTSALSEGAKEVDAKELEKMKPEDRQRYEDLKKLKDLPKEDKDLILERTKGLTGDALVKEMAAIDAALKTDNADRALGAYADIQKVIDDAKAEPDAKKGEVEKRLNSDVVTMMLSGVATHRANNEDDRGVLGRNNARDAARALVSMSPENAAEMQKLLDKASGPHESSATPPTAEELKENEKAKATQQALLLKAIAARRDELKTDASAPEDNANPRALAMHDLEGFAKDIRGLSHFDLIQVTGVRNLASDGHYNEGLKQLYADTCGATEVIGKRADVDPIYAMSLHKDGKGLDDADGKAAAEQERIHENATGHRAASREALEINNRTADQITSSELGDYERRLVFRLMRGEHYAGPLKVVQLQALQKLREENDGHPTDDEIRMAQGREGKGIAKEMHAAKITDELNAEAGGAANLKYKDGGDKVEQTLEGQFKAQADLDRALKDGQSVPIQVGDPSKGTGHYLTVLDVRTNGDTRSYCIHEPMSGKTQWVNEEQYRSGKFVKNFGIEDDVKVERTHIGEEDPGA